MSAFRAAFASHWPEALIEASGLGLFMVSALGFSVLLEHPASPVHAALPDPLVRRACMGLAMGATAVALVYSRFGKRSGAHFNPAFTFTFFRLGRVAGADAALYAGAHFAGAVAGVAAAGLALGPLVGDPHVAWAVTRPGSAGPVAAFAGEAAISCGLMLAALILANAPRTNRFTGLACGALIALYITFEAPLSGTSMNPARTFGSGAGAGAFPSLWIYFLAPPLGMLLAAEVFVRWRGLATVRCAKLHHQNSERCIFRCGWATAEETKAWTATT